MPERTGSPPMGKWRPVPEELVRFYHEALEAVPEVEPRKMFGLPCSFVNRQMFAGLHQESMVVRLAEADRPALLSTDGARPFEPMAGRVMREYVVLPPSVLSSPDQLSEWLRRAFEYARSLPPKPAKPRQARRPGGG